MDALSLLPAALAFVLAPLQFGLINRVKAAVAGRRGPPLLQTYSDLAKLMAKGAVYSNTTTWVVRAGPTVGLAAVACAVFFLPLGPVPAAVGFQGDLLVLVYLLALQRFFTQLAALDTGSSFEGMGASREALFSALAEPALLLGLLVAVRGAGSASLTGLLGKATVEGVASAGPTLVLVAVALYLVYLAENARVPVDDPNTHLELTMIHEVMVLDHGGVDLAYITFAAALKMWVLGTVIVGLVLPTGGSSFALAAPAFLAGMLLLCLLTGVVESTTARLRLTRVPRLLVGAGGMSVLALLLVIF